MPPEAAHAGDLPSYTTPAVRRSGIRRRKTIARRERASCSVSNAAAAGLRGVSAGLPNEKEGPPAVEIKVKVKVKVRMRLEVGGNFEDGSAVVGTRKRRSMLVIPPKITRMGMEMEMNTLIATAAAGKEIQAEELMLAGNK